MRERDGLIAIHQLTGVGWHTIDKLMQVGWQPDQALTAEQIDRLTRMQVLKKTIERIRAKWTPAFIKQVKEELQNRQILALTQFDEEYPPLLREIAQPPWVLYVKGNVQLLQEPSIAIVGTRKPTSYGKKMTKQLSEQLVEAGWTIVSGLANGIDGEAHRSTLQQQGKTVAVLGSGVDVVYPKNHRSLYQTMVAQGAVISEMSPGTQPLPGLFPQRNRIISGLAQGTIVVEAAEKSGSLITADFSMEQGRDVFAVPGPSTSNQSIGTLRLIQQGAKCVIETGDILEEYRHMQPLRRKPLQKEQEEDRSVEVPLSEREQAILSRIGLEPIRLDRLIEQMRGRWSVSEIQQTLFSLQLQQLIVQLPGMQVVRK
jgi:DNA processing protein